VTVQRNPYVSTMSRHGRAGVFCTTALLLFAAGVTPARAQAPSATGNHNAPEHGHYELRSAANGTYFYREPGFTASIAADGTVTFHEASWTPQSKTYDLVTHAPQGVNEVFNGDGNLNDRLAYRGDIWKPEAWPVPLPADTRPTIYDLHDQAQAMDPMRPEMPVADPIFADPGLRADLTDQYIRLMGDDPYGPQKAAFLTGTFDVRMRMAAQQHHANVSAAFDDLSRELVKVWGDKRFSIAERSHIIYLMWLDTSADDADALRARRMIQDFVHRNLPPTEAARFSRPGQQHEQPGSTELPMIQ
jgi:hypothetical protein